MSQDVKRKAGTIAIISRVSRLEETSLTQPSLLMAEGRIRPEGGMWKVEEELSDAIDEPELRSRNVLGD